MSLELSGKIHKILAEQSGTSRNGNWVKQDFVIETQDQYPKKVCVTAWGEKVEELSHMKPGDDIKLWVNLESREYNERWYTDVKVWKMEPLSAANSGPQAGGDGFEYMEPADKPDSSPADDDDLPF